jgi:hypothetical protein
MAVTFRNVCVFCLWECVKLESDVNNQGTLEALLREVWNDILNSWVTVFIVCCRICYIRTNSACMFEDTIFSSYCVISGKSVVSAKKNVFECGWNFHLDCEVAV